MINLLLTIVLLLGMLWAVLPGGFGLHNFTASHGQPWIAIATMAWGLLILSHPFVFYKLWFSQADAYGWMLLPLILHVVFFTTFGRNVGT